MKDRIDRCVIAVVASGKSEEAARAICSAQFADTYQGAFRDSVVFNPTEKHAISVRDGVLEYLGIELGMEPPDQMFTVYRSPATIANTAPKMRGLPITDEHVPLDVTPPSNGGFVAEADMVDARDENTKTTIAIRNTLALSDTLQATVAAGKRELSLGYNADLVPHDLYDFEQKNIKPHHLAAVQAGRCGSMCSFIDRKPTTEDPIVKSKLHKAFNDAEGAMSIQQIFELAAAFPEAIKAVPVDQLAKLLPALKQIIEAAKAVMPAEEPADPAPAEPAPAEPAADADPTEGDPEKDKPAFSDADVKAATDKAIKRHAVVIEKARQFLPETYQFADKSTADIMRDTLATVESDKFADTELALAFKLLKKPTAQYKSFGDSGHQSSFINLQDKEL